MDSKSPTRPNAVFSSTQWSVVLAAGRDGSSSAQAALETLCRSYWPPLYAYVRRQGHVVEEAQDITQDFFVRFLGKGYVQRADPERGRFRSFLLTSLKHFLVNEWRRGQVARRGGGLSFISWEATGAEDTYRTEPVDGLSPDDLFDRRWAATLLEQVMEQLRAEYAAAGKGALLDKLKSFIWGGTATESYAEVGAGLGMSDGAARVAVHRLRNRYRDLLRRAVAETVATPAAVDEELRYLIQVIRR